MWQSGSRSMRIIDQGGLRRLQWHLCEFRLARASEEVLQMRTRDQLPLPVGLAMLYARTFYPPRLSSLHSQRESLYGARVGEPSAIPGHVLQPGLLRLRCQTTGRPPSIRSYVDWPALCPPLQSISAAAASPSTTLPTSNKANRPPLCSNG